MRAQRSTRARRLWLVAGAVVAFAGGAGLVAALPDDRPSATPATREAPATPDATPAAAAPAAPAASGEGAPTGAPAVSRAVGPEEDAMERLRAVVDEQPQVALALADAADADFPSGRHADERAYLRMRALVHLGDIGKARTIAGEFFERHPESPYGRFVYRLTGMRPRPIGPPS
jgi:hypothetical protein